MTDSYLSAAARARRVSASRSGICRPVRPLRPVVEQACTYPLMRGMGKRSLPVLGRGQTRANKFAHGARRGLTLPSQRGQCGISRSDCVKVHVANSGVRNALGRFVSLSVHTISVGGNSAAERTFAPFACGPVVNFPPSDRSARNAGTPSVRTSCDPLGLATADLKTNAVAAQRERPDLRSPPHQSCRAPAAGRSNVTGRNPGGTGMRIRMESVTGKSVRAKGERDGNTQAGVLRRSAKPHVL